MLPNKFTAEGQDANQFCELLLERAENSGWNNPACDIINFQVDSQVINLFTGYGRLTTEQIIQNSNHVGNQD